MDKNNNLQYQVKNTIKEKGKSDYSYKPSTATKPKK